MEKNWINSFKFYSDQHEWYEKETLNQISSYFIGDDIRYIVEIGCSDNSYHLNDPMLNKATGLLIDGSSEKLKVYNGIDQFKTISMMINPNNIVDILLENNVPNDFFMLNLDIDGLDFFVLLSILKKYKPKHIVTEYNEKIPSNVKYTIKNDDSFRWGWCHNYGYSVACIEDIMTMFGYKIDNIIVNNIYLTKIEDDKSPNIEDVYNLYKSSYVDKKDWLYESFSPWNKDVDHLHGKTKMETEILIADYFRNNLNVNNGSSMVDELDKYIIGEEYDEYIRTIKKNINI